jgi:hypothetical protein
MMKNKQIINCKLPSNITNFNDKNSKVSSLTKTSNNSNGDGIHVYTSSSSLSNKNKTKNNKKKHHSEVKIEKSNSKDQNESAQIVSLLPDPLMKIERIIGFGNDPSQTQQSPSNVKMVNCIQWTLDGQFIIYASHSILIAYNLQTNEQKYYLGKNKIQKK